LEQGGGDSAPPGAHIEHEVAWAHTGVSDYAPGPPGVEFVPSPPTRWRGHGDAPSRRDPRFQSGDPARDPPPIFGTGPRGQA
jgi:hypothetical protein